MSHPIFPALVELKKFQTQLMHLHEESLRGQLVSEGPDFPGKTVLLDAMRRYLHEATFVAADEIGFAWRLLLFLAKYDAFREMFKEIDSAGLSAILDGQGSPPGVADETAARARKEWEEQFPECSYRSIHEQVEKFKELFTGFCPQISVFRDLPGFPASPDNIPEKLLQ